MYDAQKNYTTCIMFNKLTLYMYVYNRSRNDANFCNFLRHYAFRFYKNSKY